MFIIYCQIYIFFFHHLFTLVQDVYSKSSTHLGFYVFLSPVQMCVSLQGYFIFVSEQNWQCVLKRYTSDPGLHMGCSPCQPIIRPRESVCV